MLRRFNVFNKWQHKSKSTRYIFCSLIQFHWPIEALTNGFPLFRIQPGPEVYPKLEDLPEECIREIVLRIRDHRDLESSSAAWTLMAALASEQRVWRELTQFHFTQHQIDQMIEKQLNNKHNNNNNNNSTPNNTDNQGDTNVDNSTNETGNNQRPPKAGADDAAEEKPSKRVMNAKDWQKVYHALKR